MKKLAGLVAALAFLPPVAVWAQGSGANAPREPVDSGAIIMPSKPPEGANPKVEVPPPEQVKKRATKPAQKARKDASKRKQSKDSACKGPAELCKQATPR